MKRLIFLLAISLFVIPFINGCSRKAAFEKKALAPYASATLTPGVGLGDLILGQTSIDWVVSQLGSGLVSGIAGDDAAIELIYLDEQLSLLFIVSGECQTVTEAPGKRLPLTQNLEDFFKRFPACRKLTITSISVATRNKSKEEIYFKGGTNFGIKLWDPIFDALRHGKPVQAAGNLVAGFANPIEDMETLKFPAGIYFYYPAGASPTGDEMMAGKPLSQERIQELKDSAEAAKKDPTIKRMTIFIPET